MHLQSGSIFQPAMLVYPEFIERRSSEQMVRKLGEMFNFGGVPLLLLEVKNGSLQQ